MEHFSKAKISFIIFVLLMVSICGFDQFSSKDTSLNQKISVTINEVMVSNRNSAKDEDGDFEDWIELYNYGDTAVNLKDFGLTNKPEQRFLWQFPDRLIEPKSFLLVWASAKDKKGDVLHTDFKLSKKNRALIITSPDARWSDIYLLQSMGDNISSGRKPDGGSKICYFDEGSPGKSNTGETLTDGAQAKRLKVVAFSQAGGFYNDAFSLSLSVADENAVIYYTLDGSEPTQHSSVYDKPIRICESGTQMTVVRARAYKTGCPKSEISTQSYFVCKDILEKYTIPVVSLVTNPDNLFDYDIGIYTPGRIFDEWTKQNPSAEPDVSTPANYNQRGRSWEREAHFELFEPGGKVAISQNAGIRTFGVYSRAEFIKSLSVTARSDYDEKDEFSYDIFKGKARNSDNEALTSFKRILLRTSSTDCRYTLFRDALIQSLIQPTKLDTQSSQPCILYINGEYYGIHNIREAYDKHYISSHYGIDEDDVVMIKNPTGDSGGEVEEGFAEDQICYDDLINYIKQHDITDKKSYAYVKTRMDVDNYIDYNILEIYCDNRDWPGINLRIWRKRTQQYEANAPYGQDGLWRWMVFDLDYGFGLYTGADAAKNNTLKMATESDVNSWPNPPWSTFLLRSLLTNDQFKNEFINRFADLLNTNFRPDVVLGKIQTFHDLYSPYIDEHMNKYNLYNNDKKNWEAEVNILREFALKRPEYVRQHIMEYFGLSGLAAVKIDTCKGGTVMINSLPIKKEDMPWNGVYFQHIPVTLQAVPEKGYTFSHWEGEKNSYNQTITLDLSKPVRLKAVFIPK